MATQTASMRPLDERRSIYSKRRLDAALETVAAFVGLVAINLIWWPDSLGWTDVLLHPYFVPVLLIASRYGTVDGITSGTLGAALYTWFRYHAEPSAFTDAGFLVDLELMTTPYLLLLLGTVLGEVRQVAQDEIDGLWQRYKRLRSDLDNVSTEARQVHQANEELQERIAATTQTTGAFYDVAAQVQTLNEDEALPAILEMVHRFVGADKSAIYVRSPSGWELRVNRGWADPAEFARVLPLDDPAMRAVVDGRVVSLKDVEGEGANRDVLMAAPLYHGDVNEGPLFGAIVVQSIPLGKVNLGTVRNLEGIGRWGSQVLSAADSYERVKERDPADQITGTYRYPYVRRRLDEECARWARYQTPVTLLLVQVQNFERVPRIKRAAFVRRLGRLVMRNVRQVDLVSRWKSADTFALVLPSTPSTGARILASRINDQFDREIGADVPETAEIRLRFGVATTGEHGDDREDLVESAEKLGTV